MGLRFLRRSRTRTVEQVAKAGGIPVEHQYMRFVARAGAIERLKPAPGRQRPPALTAQLFLPQLGHPHAALGPQGPANRDRSPAPLTSAHLLRAKARKAV